MMSYLKVLPLIAVTLILSACGGTESSSDGNLDNTNPPPITSNNPPQISGTPTTTATVDVLYSFTPNVSDPDGDSLSFSASSLPTWISLDPDSGTISGTPGASDVGLTGEIILTVSDGTAEASLAPFAITVGDGGDLQVVSVRVGSGMDDVEEEADSSIYPDSSDLELVEDGGAQLVGMRFALSIPQNALIRQANLRFTTDEVTTAETNLVVWAEASDDAPAFTTAAGNVSSRSSTLASVNWQPPAWNTVGESAAAQTSSDLTTVIQEVISRPGWSSGNHLVLVISGSGVRTAESYEGSASSAPLLTVSYTTTDANRAPTINGIPSSGATVGESYSFTPVASDPDGDSLSFTASYPSWINFNDQTGTLSGIPGAGDVGSHSNISITVSDGEHSATLGPFTILVSANNHAPTISGTPVTSVVEQSNYSFTPTAADQDGDSLVFSINQTPSWAVFNETTGNLSGTPGYDSAGTYDNIVISVSDGSVSTSLAPFTITVADLNRAPVISGTPNTSVAEGNPYSFTPSASDADGNNLVFSINTTPAWATFSTATGRLTGTPDYDSAGTYSNIVISVSDGVDSASLAPFAINVTDVNRAPVISGTPSLSVTAGTAYSFVPSATDADGDSLTFAINTTPSWANFDVNTGTLSGTPQESDVGSYANLQISVSDGNEVVALSAFTITVESSSTNTGSISLSWTPPSTRTDSTTLNMSEIGGYVVYMGTSRDNLQMRVDINDGTATSYTINDVTSGTYYIALTTYDTEGTASSYSNIITRTVN